MIDIILFVLGSVILFAAIWGILDLSGFLDKFK